ncbi:MAG: ComF family protein [Lentisphaerae bacterium]|nr:ComF family protein [Lentisphaerota bacterium]
MKFLHRAINFLWEFPCPLCDCDNRRGGMFNTFCVDCLEKLPLFHGVRCPGCGGELDGIFDQCSQCLKMPKRPWNNAMSLMKMEDLGEKAVYALKFSGVTAIARAAAELAIPLLAHPDFSQCDMIVPVPLHWQRQMQRSYNQSELLAKMLARGMKKPCKTPLKRIRPTLRQATLSRDERLKNLKGAFTVPEPATVANKKILLVDDVLTTGATLHACAEALLQAGAASVSVFTVARR